MKKYLIPISLGWVLVVCSWAWPSKKQTPPLSQEGGQVKSVQSVDKGFSSTEIYQIASWNIKRYENLKFKPYRCEAGILTIGWGFNMKATGIKSINSANDADEKFRKIFTPIKERVDRDYSDLTPLQRVAVISLVYNTGSFELVEKSTFVKELRRGNIKKARRSFLSWNKVRNGKRHVVSRGLTARRNFEAKYLDESFSKQDYNQLKNEVAKIYLANK